MGSAGAGGNTAGPGIHWQDPGGSATDIGVPFGGGFFHDVTTATAYHLGDVFTGDPECYGSMASRRFAPVTSAESGGSIHENATIYSEMAFSVAGVIATLDGKAYRAVGIFPVDPTNFTTTSRVWVLCERSPEDDPEDTA